MPAVVPSGLMATWCLALLLAARVQRPVLAQRNPGVSEVATADDLRRAVQGGSEHILITDHMDLSGLPALSNSVPYPKPFNPGQALQTVRVRCRMLIAPVLPGNKRYLCFAHGSSFLSV